MTRARMAAAVAAVMLLAAVPVRAGQLDATALPTVEQRLVNFADRMRLGLSIASVAAFSPTIKDARAQAERLIFLLRGGPRDEAPSLLAESLLLNDWIASRSFEPELRQTLVGATDNVRTFLKLALEAATAVSRDRTLVGAAEGLLKTYAFFLAAWGQPVDGVVVPGVVTLLRAFEIPAQ